MRPVELGLLALHLEADLLAARRGQVADDARELAQTLPIGCMRVFMTPSCSSLVIEVQPLGGGEKGAVLLVGGELQDLVAGQHQLADQVHQLVEQVDVDADGAVRHGGARFTLVLQIS